MISLFRLRYREPTLERPFKAPLYPFFPAFALALSVVSLGAIVYFNPLLSLLFFGALGLGLLIFLRTGMHHKVSETWVYDGDSTPEL